MSTRIHRAHGRKRLQLDKRVIEILRIQVVSAGSINFHIWRGDFQKWIEDMLGDTGLAKRIILIELTLPAEDL